MSENVIPALILVQGQQYDNVDKPVKKTMRAVSHKHVERSRLAGEFVMLKILDLCLG